MERDNKLIVGASLKRQSIRIRRNTKKFGELPVIKWNRLTFLAAAACFLSACAGPTLDLGPTSELGAGSLAATRAATIALRPASHSLREALIGAGTGAPGTIPSEELNSSIDTDFAKTLTECQTVLSGYESESTRLKWISFGIAMVGTISGAVVVPALSAATSVNKVAVAAFGGLSGASNSAQNVLNSDNLTSTDALATRDAIRQDFNSALSAYFKARSAGNSNDEISALEQAQSACVSYAVQSGATITNAPGAPAPAPAPGS